MADTFLTRIPALADAELRAYAHDPLAYRTAAVEAALEELARRGQALSPEELARIRADLARRDAELHGATEEGNEEADLRRRKRRRRIAAAILAVGLSASGIAFIAAGPPQSNPLGYEPEDTKRYLRDLEMYGGKANVMATEFQRWFAKQWEGRRLASTLATLTLLLALPFWVAGRPSGERRS
ncbi:hypothetical protein [Geothrix sp. 21YS21S-4]|uniref:hypothetical protein n=1 Tax=Geothrix sp. 21YS21S-4 TaxID=3068889 RepID=UPI0027BAF9D6|nr:hypothetical protein [Geothrix sp. 21YS21S-4]